MQQIATIDEIRQAIRSFRQHHPRGKVGFIPTMGYLHEGHLGLVRTAREQCDFVVMSIFVNPLQFGPNEDLDRYPRDLAGDLRLAKEAGVNIVFTPDAKEMYPRESMLTTVRVQGVSERLCGSSRPVHFDGVATVVAKLFQIVQPDDAFFGSKDAQQIAVIMRMVEDLNMPIHIVTCPTVREQDGLALSSRNVYLSQDERKQAVVLSTVLNEAKTWITELDMTVGALRDRIEQRIHAMPLAVIDYVEIVNFPAITPYEDRQLISDLSGQLMIALAVFFNRTRLIDNHIFHLQDKTEVTTRV